MNTKMAQDICNMSDEELADELTRPDNDLVYKLYLNSIALSRILSRLQHPELPAIPPYRNA